MKLAHLVFFIFTLLLVTLSTVIAAPLPSSPSIKSPTPAAAPAPENPPASPPHAASRTASGKEGGPSGANPNVPAAHATAEPSDAVSAHNDGSESDSKAKPSTDDPKTNDAFCFSCFGGSPGMGAPHFDGHLFGG